MAGVVRAGTAGDVSKPLWSSGIRGGQYALPAPQWVLQRPGGKERLEAAAESRLKRHADPARDSA